MFGEPVFHATQAARACKQVSMGVCLDACCLDACCLAGGCTPVMSTSLQRSVEQRQGQALANNSLEEAAAELAAPHVVQDFAPSLCQGALPTDDLGMIGGDPAELGH